ncbi:MAG: hypothetical protein ACRCTQ_06395 [Brevinemataceae bacterium]
MRILTLLMFLLSVSCSAISKSENIMNDDTKQVESSDPNDPSKPVEPAPIKPTPIEPSEPVKPPVDPFLTKIAYACFGSEPYSFHVNALLRHELGAFRWVEDGYQCFMFQPLGKYKSLNLIETTWEYFRFQGPTPYMGGTGMLYISKKNNGRYLIFGNDPDFKAPGKLEVQTLKLLTFYDPNKNRAHTFTNLAALNIH